MADGEPITHRCNICAPELQRALNQGSSAGLRAAPEPGRFRGPADAPNDYLCPRCASKARTRTFATLLSQARAFLPAEGEALLVAGVRHEQRLLRRTFAGVAHVSLVGDLGDADCRVGVDIRAMPEVESDLFALAVASAVLDHVPELDQAFSEVFRVLRPGGVFLFHISPARMLFDPKATVRVRLPAPAAPGAEPPLPSCSFGPRHVADQARAAGFEIAVHQLRDPLTDLGVTWHVARKPAA